MVIVIHTTTTTTATSATFDIMQVIKISDSLIC